MGSNPPHPHRGLLFATGPHLGRTVKHETNHPHGDTDRYQPERHRHDLTCVTCWLLLAAELLVGVLDALPL